MAHTKKIIPLLLAFSCVSTNSLAAGDGDLWVGLVAMVCLAKNPELYKTPIGEGISKKPEFIKAVNSLKDSPSGCLAKKEWISAGLCDELLNSDPKKKLEADALGKKYEKEIAGLDQLTKCETDANKPQ